jgi:hypothetical protein
VIQPRTQTSDYWGPDFVLTDSDIEQIYNHFLEVEQPQKAREIANVIIAHRVAEEIKGVERRLAGRTVYQPKSSYKKGDELVFPALKFAQGEVTGRRDGYNPQYGRFDVIKVQIKGKTREFAANLEVDHPLNAVELGDITGASEIDLDQLYEWYGDAVEAKVTAALESREEFLRLGQLWFVKALMAEVNIGHLHLAEAILEINEGGPLQTDAILTHLDMDPSLDQEVLRFSLNYSLIQDNRFDEVAPQGQVIWFLRRLEPEGVRETPGRLQYTPIPHDRALLSPQLLLLERELDDEWSDLRALSEPQPVVFSLMFPHRWAGTLPLSARIRPLFPPSRSPRQRVILRDEESGEDIVGWVVQEQRYVYGLGDWYEANNIPIGGFIQLKPGPEPGVILLNFDRRRAQREWVRLATVVDNRINFDLMRRSVGCGYDDLLIVGTDVVAAIDALWRRAESQQRSVASLLAEIFPQLVKMNPQNTVHAKTLYSAINMLRRVPPGPLFAELVRHPAFQAVGDHYWRFESSRWQRGN